MRVLSTLGVMRLRSTRLAVVLGALACATHALPAYAWMPGPTPSLLCGFETNAAEAVGRHSALLSPPNGATVLAGAPVTFSAESGDALSFRAASSPALLSSPDVDSGPGSLEPGTQPGGGYGYTFTSVKATATPGTIYWAASFTVTLKECTGPPFTYTTPASMLTVSPQTPTREPSPAAEPTSALQLRIIGAASFRLKHPTVTYRVTCSASCSGTTELQAWHVHRHRKPVRASALDVGSTSLSITAASGGGEQFTHRYRGAALRMLKHIVNEGGEVELRLRVEAADATGTIVRAYATRLLRG